MFDARNDGYGILAVADGASYVVVVAVAVAVLVVVAISAVVPSVVDRAVVDVSSGPRDVSVLLTDSVIMTLDSSFEKEVDETATVVVSAELNAVVEPTVVETSLVVKLSVILELGLQGPA
ncbi:hypothetical protein DER44DRAFT_746644 [Fusarium oxysporum]|nr:hypothetical protein DER44DRAFT_746644 [Fusarium oxysporum]